MAEEIEIIVPGQDDDAVSNYMVLLTRELAKLRPDSQAHGCLGGEDGYGCEFVTDAFEMHPFYWGDCTCGFDEKRHAADTTWCAANPHAPDCYDTELHARTAAYDEESGYNRIDEAARSAPMNVETTEDEMFGMRCIRTLTSRTEAGEAAHQAWCYAHDKRRGFLDSLYTELTAKFSLPMQGCACHCTCGRRERFGEMLATLGDHDPRCPIVLPNFLHKASGARIEWYKYIGRDMKVEAPEGFDWQACIQECIAAAKASA